MEYKYNCEIEGCMNMTEDFLCAFHETEAKNENMQVVVCETCNKIIQINRKKLTDPRYSFVKDCMRCHPYQIDSGMFEDQLPPDVLPLG
jgi:hypothetical protein